MEKGRAAGNSYIRFGFSYHLCMLFLWTRKPWPHHSPSQLQSQYLKNEGIALEILSVGMTIHYGVERKCWMKCSSFYNSGATFTKDHGLNLLSVAIGTMGLVYHDHQAP